MHNWIERGVVLIKRVYSATSDKGRKTKLGAFIDQNLEWRKFTWESLIRYHCGMRNSDTVLAEMSQAVRKHYQSIAFTWRSQSRYKAPRLGLLQSRTTAAGSRKSRGTPEGFARCVCIGRTKEAAVRQPNERNKRGKAERHFRKLNHSRFGDRIHYSNIYAALNCFYSYK